jgi:hypothetical protein
LRALDEPMSRKQSRKQRKRQAAARRTASTAPTKNTNPANVKPRAQSFRAHIELTALELASGHDGLLRGMPEPVVLLGAFLLTDGQARSLGRVLVRTNQPAGRFPTVVTPTAQAALLGRGRAASGASGARIAVLAIALEEDSGKDVERVYAHLENGKALRVWALDDAVPHVTTLAELGASAPSEPPIAPRVGVLDEGADLRDLCKDDEMVGAALFLIGVNRQEEGFRLHFVSSDRKNDWTAIVGVSVE